jgi:hypothetical protein
VNDGDIKWAHKTANGWQIEIADAEGPAAGSWTTSLEVDRRGLPQIIYWNWSAQELRYASKASGAWNVETLDDGAYNGRYCSLALDAQDNPHVAYVDETGFDVRYASAAIELTAPAPGDNWPVGSSRSITWGGTGRVDLYVSIAGGDDWQLVEDGLVGGSYDLIVPHTPSHFVRYKLERAIPYSVAMTPGFVTIETSIDLLAFAVGPAPEGSTGTFVSWSTNPGPADLAGYRLERAAEGEAWRTLLP